MIESNTMEVLGGMMSFLSSEINSGRETILFIHGLGESNQSFLEAFQEPELQSCNLIAPDLLGYGKSSDATQGGYLLSSQVTRLIQLLEDLGIRNCHIVGHSMGGDLGVLLCYRRPDLIRTLVNIEGDLTTGDRFITNQAMDAIQTGFSNWFATTFRQMVLERAEKMESWRRYLSALATCREEAFLENVLEIYDLNNQLGNAESIIANRYRLLPVPKVYCWGTETLSPKSRQYLRDNKLLNQPFDGSGHWVMQDRREAFYSFLAGFLWVS